jgi:uncharacterized membrane protein YfcA
MPELLTNIVFDFRLVLVIICVFVGGFIRGYTGFGSALAIIPSLAMIFNAREAVAMHSIMEIPVILSMVPGAARVSDRSIVVPMIIALLLATPFGAYLLYSINPDVMRIVISLVVLVMVALLYFRSSLAHRFGRTGATVAGLVGGFSQGATGMGGPPVVTVLLSRGDNNQNARANVFTVMSAMIFASILSFWAFGLFTAKVLLIGVIASPFCLAATWLGARYFKGSGQRHFQKAALAVLAALALSTFITAVL